MNLNEAGNGQANTNAGNPQDANSAGATPPSTPPQGQTTPPEGEQGQTGQQGQSNEPNYELKMPEGIDLDKDAAAEFVAFAKEQGIKPDQAQRVAEIGAKMMQRQAEAHARTVSTWVEQVKADKEIGGEKLEENLAVARSAIEAFGTPELKDVLNSTGLGNHPAVVKFFYQAGKRISQDSFVGGNRSPSGEKDPSKILFPSMN